MTEPEVPTIVRDVARVLVDTPLPHLDRAFDYAVPPELDESAVPGARVKVRFSGKKYDGFVLDRVAVSAHHGRLSPLLSVVSSEPVLTADVARLARSVADRYAGTMADVLRLAIPPRHARAEAHPAQDPQQLADDPGASAWYAYLHGPAFVEHIATGGSPRAVLSALARHEPALAVAQAVAAALRSGRGAVVCVPDVRDVERWDRVFSEVLGVGQYVVLTSALKPADRYRAYLRVRRGEAKVVLGTRAAAYAPVRDLGLVVIWDDGDDLHAEQRAPYPHTREVLLIRAVQHDAAVLIAGYARTAEAQSLLDQGWCQEIAADQPTRRREWPLVEITDGAEAGRAPIRLPHRVFAAIREAEGPVLIQVPRRGYRSSLACQDCRTPATCAACSGPLHQVRADAPPVCRWCGIAASPWVCRACGSARLRSPVVGQLRTAEEFARAFADRDVLTSGGDLVLDEVAAERALVLATPGAEPPAVGGYRLVVLLDTWLMLARDDVRVVEEAHRRWFNALSLAAFGARAVAVGDSTMLQALVRADPASVAVRELAGRAETHLPPVGRLAIVDGPSEDLAPLVTGPWTAHTEVLGPVPLERGEERLVLRAPRREGAELAHRLKQAAAARSAAKRPPLRIQLDPPSF